MDPTPRRPSEYAEDLAEVVPTPTWVDQLARLGYFAIGVVYVLIGLLAALGVAGVGEGKLTGAGGAIRTLLRQPFGRVLLAVVAVGLVVFVCWRFAQSVLDVEHRGGDRQGLLRRGGLALSGLSYTGLTVIVVERLVTGTGSIQDPKTNGWTAELMSHPGGAVLVGLVGAGVVAAGLAQFYRARRRPRLRRFQDDTMSSPTQQAVARLGQVGCVARGVVFTLIGGFLITAAWQTDPQEARGLGGALQTLGEQPYGAWLIGVVAVGLMLHGLFMLAKIPYRSFDAPEETEGEDEPPNG